VILSLEKLKKSWDWHGFGGLEVLWPKRAASLSLQLCKFPNFTNGKNRYLKGDPLDLTQKASLVDEL
jgi:hypothetical protein